MKRVIALVLILLFPSLSFAATKEWYNNPQYLTKIPRPSIGDIVRTKPGSGNLLPTVVALASDASPTVNIASGILSVPLYAYSPLAGMAGQYVIGKGLQAAVDLMDNYNNGTLQTNSTLNDLIRDTFTSSGSDLWQPGDVLLGDNGTTRLKLGEPYSGNGYQLLSAFNSAYPRILPGSIPELHYYGTSLLAYLDTNAPHPTLPGYFLRMLVPYTTTTDPVTYPRQTEPPLSLTASQLLQLATRIADEIAANNETLKDALKNLVRDNPQLAPDPQQITNQDIANYSNQQIYDNRQESIDYLTNQYNQAVTNNNTELANYYQDKIQEEQARQEEEQAKEDKEESFNPISDNPFQVPYNPGAFDIPARFTSFLNNVKSNGLFSFSSSFFNSLPGGGSPIYTVEAGTYGTHTIDLSETMATGLAVLKTVLLLLFGFLSIRVVILKR